MIFGADGRRLLRAKESLRKDGKGQGAGVFKLT